MIHPATTGRDWDESASAAIPSAGENGPVIENFVERSVDAVLLFDPQAGVFVDCNQAAVELMRARTKDELLGAPPEHFAPPLQPDGVSSREKTAQIVALVEEHGSHRFEWTGRSFDGREIPMEVLVTQVRTGGRKLNVSIARDITERKTAERELRQLNQSLERRVAERTAELTTSEARFRALVEHAPEAIVVFDGDAERILFGNQHACDLYGVPMERLAELTPATVSPEFQPNGRRSTELAREKMDEALAGGMPVFEWIHRCADGRLIPTEVRLLRLPAEGQNLLRASIIDNTERKRAEEALRDSEEKFRALFEGSSSGVILHDEREFLEVNSAAVRIMGCQSPEELLGKHPRDTSPPFQPNGESSGALADKHIQECMTHGSARFEWTCCTRQGALIPLEVTLTRIQWSGRQVIQALFNDISQRKQVESELRASEARLRESEARFSIAFQASPVIIGILQVSDGKFVLANDALVNWLGCSREETLGQSCAALGMWENLADRASVWEEVGRVGRIRQRECRWRNRRGEQFTVLLSAETITMDNAPHVLLLAQDITQRKQSEMNLRASEARLRESEARFSVAFHANPALVSIFRASDGKYVLMNDAFLKWLGYSHEEVVGRNCLELGVWENPADREVVLQEIQASGSIRQRECRWRNRSGDNLTVLLSIEPITVNDAPHMLSMALDITQRKQAEVELRASETRLRESEARFRAAFRASPAWMTISRMDDGRYVLANEAFFQWTGYRLDEVLGRNSLELALWVDPAEREPLWEELRRAGAVHGRELRVRNRHGKISTMLLSSDVIEVNRVPHLLTVGLDITERKLAEAELQRALTREMELSQLKSNFVSMVSHEFRTPLGIIQSSAELLRDFYERMPPAERGEQLESISRNTSRMAEMMEEILILSRLDAGKLEFQPVALDLNVFCRRTVDEVLSATNRRCAIELSLASVPRDALADERLLGHIFTNLLSNAVKYSESGATVRFAVERDGPDAVCIVCDQGIGISDEDQQHLFNAFHRGANVGTRPGTGLGLLMVKRCVELHRGRVRLRSKLGEGTTVTVRLPVFGKDS